VEDESGAIISRWFVGEGASVLSERVLPDDSVSLLRTLEEILEKECPDFLISTGGTGLSSRDITPETMREFARRNEGREIPGIGELLRSSGSRKTRYAWLSRSSAFLVKGALLVCLPGSPKAVAESLEEIGGILRHAKHTVRGGRHDSPETRRPS
jgi:molybdenum cofactor synthesis domain-containing protein